MVHRHHPYKNLISILVKLNLRSAEIVAAEIRMYSILRGIAAEFVPEDDAESFLESLDPLKPS